MSVAYGNNLLYFFKIYNSPTKTTKTAVNLDPKIRTTIFSKHFVKLVKWDISSKVSQLCVLAFSVNRTMPDRNKVIVYFTVYR